ncbi:SDR family oxidoreductase [Pseudaeromonas pectinilytica]
MKFAIITGASGGIGRAVAERLAAEGWSLLLIARDGARLSQLRLELGEAYPALREQIAWLALDLTALDAMDELLSYLGETQQTVDLVIHAAGCQRFACLGDQDDSAMEQQLALNLRVPMQLTRSLLPVMAPGSTIVTVGSTFGAIGYPGFSVYCATKAGLHAFSEALARELGPDGPRVCLLVPRATATELNHGAVDAMNQALGTAVDSPARVASELMQLLASRQRRRFIGWPEKFFVRLNALLPWLVDRAIGAQREQICGFATIRPAARQAPVLPTEEKQS